MYVEAISTLPISRALIHCLVGFSTTGCQGQAWAVIPYEEQHSIYQQSKYNASRGFHEHTILALLPLLPTLYSHIFADYFIM